jgi:histidinol-phosphate/aromatic aminotransferase/cobyric acid decarboxylase-like protein
MVGRDFPPFEGSHVRVSIGTMDEMQKATTTFRDVLRPVAPIGSGGGGR